MRTTVHPVRTPVLIALFTLAVFFTKAQSFTTFDGKVEVGAGIGPLFFLGDLGGNLGQGTYFVKDVNLPLTKMAKGLFINYAPAEWIGFRVAFNQGTLQGADSAINEKGGAEAARYVRNLHFRSNLLEAYGAIEFYPTVFFEKYDGLQGKLRPYVVLGAGVFKFKPQAEYYSPNGTKRWVDLPRLHTEGQGFAETKRPNYKLMSMEIPFGGGLKWYVKENMFVGFEMMLRKTFTDYVDDVSTTYIDPALFDKYLAPEDAVVAKQVNFRGTNPTFRLQETGKRGNAKNNDSYFSSILRLGWRLYGGGDVSQMSCPKW